MVDKGAELGVSELSLLHGNDYFPCWYDNYCWLSTPVAES